MDDRATDVFGPPREPTEEDPLAGTPYRFLRRLGAGGMGEVVEAEHETLGHRVALKLLHIEYLTSSEIRERMRLEAQACARIRHDNLVPVHDFGETSDGRVFLAMELLRGRSLADELDARGFLPVEEAVEITRQALSGLAAAHAAGIVHRDIKPENLFLCDFADGSRRVKVLDFGIAKIAHHAGPLTPEPLLKPTAEGMTVGTARWSSPEQSRGEADIDDRSDVYSAGWVLHTMLTGRPPFPHLRTNGDLFAAHSTRVPDAPSVMAPQRIPVTLDAIVLKAIAKRKEDRFPGAEAFRVELGPDRRGSWAQDAGGDDRAGADDRPCDSGSNHRCLGRRDRTAGAPMGAVHPPGAAPPRAGSSLVRGRAGVGGRRVRWWPRRSTSG